jgi:hypothetical protein
LRWSFSSRAQPYGIAANSAELAMTGAPVAFGFPEVAAGG